VKQIVFPGDPLPKPGDGGEVLGHGAGRSPVNLHSVPPRASQTARPRPEILHLVLFLQVSSIFEIILFKMF